MGEKLKKLLGVLGFSEPIVIDRRDFSKQPPTMEDNLRFLRAHKPQPQTLRVRTDRNLEKRARNAERGGSDLCL